MSFMPHFPEPQFQVLHMMTHHYAQWSGKRLSGMTETDSGLSERPGWKESDLA